MEMWKSTKVGRCGVEWGKGCNKHVGAFCYLCPCDISEPIYGSETKLVISN